MKNSVLFLDIDGVIATDDSYNSDKFIIESNPNIEVPYKWNMNCLRSLEDIVFATNCDIVISSDWRIHYTLQQIKLIFNYYDIDILVNKIVGMTDNKKAKMSSSLEMDREYQVVRYLKANKIRKWCAVDDMSLHLTNFALIKDTKLGIANKQIVKKIISYLK